MNKRLKKDKLDDTDEKYIENHLKNNAKNMKIWKSRRKNMK